MAREKVSRVFRDPVSGVIHCLWIKSEPLEVLARLTKEAFRITEETGERRWLFDARALPYMTSTFGIFQRSELVAQMVLGKKIRIAALFDPKVPVENPQFMETVARNRGLEIRVFPDEESALKWLGPRIETIKT